VLKYYRMDNPLPLEPKRRNRVTQQAHKRQVFWQISVPLIVVVIIVIALALMAGFAGRDEISTWADISLILMLIPVFIVLLLSLAVFAGSAYGLRKLTQIIPFYTFRAQSFMMRAGRQLRKISDAAVEPVLRTNSMLAGWKAFRSRLSIRRIR
jgi:lipopolysaccharide export LptBFGC system permease protein LptF